MLSTVLYLLKLCCVTIFLHIKIKVCNFVCLFKYILSHMTFRLVLLIFVAVLRLQIVFMNRFTCVIIACCCVLEIPAIFVERASNHTINEATLNCAMLVNWFNFECTTSNRELYHNTLEYLHLQFYERGSAGVMQAVQKVLKIIKRKNWFNVKLNGTWKDWFNVMLNGMFWQN